MRSRADALILDLEDSVAEDAKAGARAEIAAHLEQAGGDGPALWVRVNALSTGETEADVAATLPGRPKGYVLPKCEGRDDLDALSEMIGETEAGIVAIATETARAVRALMAADWAHPRLAGLAWGAEDLSADLGALAPRNAEGGYLSPFRLARDAMLFAAKAARVAAIDGIFTDFRDPAGLEAEARAAAAMGFDGKLAIHPAQVDPIHAGLAPSGTQIDWARRVISALEAAGGGVAQLDGRMLDRPHQRAAEAILARRDG